MPLLPQSLLPASMGFNNTSDAQVIGPEQAQYLQNALCDRPGLLRANVSVVNLLPEEFATPIDGVSYYYGIVPPPVDQMLFVSAGRLWRSSVTPGSPIPTVGVPQMVPGVVPAFTPGKRIRSYAFLDELIFLQADGSIQPLRYNGSDLFQLGINPPPAPAVAAVAPTTGNTNKITNNGGPYRYRLTFFDEKFRESSLGPETTITFTITPAPGTCGRITPPAYTDPQVQGAYLYEAVPGNNTFYRVHTFFRNPPDGPSPPWEDNLPDNQITAITVHWVNATNFRAYDIPHKASVGCVHKNNLFLNDVENPAQLQVSNLSSPTQFSPVTLSPTEGGEYSIDSDQGDPVMALQSFGSLLGIWKRRGFYVMFGDTTADFVIRSVHARGTACSDSAVRCDNALLSHSLDGVYAYDYQSVFLAHRVSQEIQSSFDALVTTAGGQASIENALAAYADEKYYLWIDTTLYVYDFRAQRPCWTTLSFPA